MDYLIVPNESVDPICPQNDCPHLTCFINDGEGTCLSLVCGAQGGGTGCPNLTCIVNC